MENSSDEVLEQVAWSSVNLLQQLYIYVRSWRRLPCRRAQIPLKTLLDLAVFGFSVTSEIANVATERGTRTTITYASHTPPHTLAFLLKIEIRQCRYARGMWRSFELFARRQTGSDERSIRLALSLRIWLLYQHSLGIGERFESISIGGLVICTARGM